LRSVPGFGSIFQVDIPLATENRTAAVETAAAAMPGANSQNG
jgi:hypothetical protein